MLPARLLQLCTCLYSNTNQLLECAQNKPCRNNCCRGRIMPDRSEGLHYFALGGLVDFSVPRVHHWKWTTKSLSYFSSPRRLHSVHKMVALGRVLSPKRHLKLENVLLQVIALEHGALRLIRRAFCNDACYIYHVWNAEPVWQSGRRPPQRKFVVWVCKFPGKFVYRNDVTHGCGYTHKWSNAQTITVENMKSKS